MHVMETQTGSEFIKTDDYFILYLLFHFLKLYYLFGLTH